MNRTTTSAAAVLLALALILFLTPSTLAQKFNFNLLEQKIQSFSVIIDMKLEISFGIHTAKQSERYLGTIVSRDGMVIFNGSSLNNSAGMQGLSGFSVKTNPTFIEISTMDGKTYEAEFIGVDRFTDIGFLRIKGDSNQFTPIEFKGDQEFQTGDWLSLYMLLPEFINPPLTADVGMISTLVESPERFPLTVGFNSLQITSVLFNKDLEPVGVLGALIDPSTANTDPSGLLESFGQYGIPLLGVITAERLERMIDDPPHRGIVDRGWLGISLQALTPDIAEYWELNLSGGIIVNEVIGSSPAEKAGLLKGDIICQVNGQQIEVDKEEKLSVFQRQMAELGPGTAVELTVIRRDDTQDDTLNLLATLKAAPMAAADADEYECESLEFNVRNMVFADYIGNNLDAETFAGVVVSEFKRGGPANVGGLRLGDIIQRIGDSEISSVEEAELAMTDIEAAKPAEVIFFVWRNNQTLFVNVKTDW
ncbi:MAG: PDZ domain-containing protein [candidate division Zixibacteria bacterium]|nr:PDZ domain-containing protein [candidate division Zixibacteria bacterium]